MQAKNKSLCAGILQDFSRVLLGTSTLTLIAGYRPVHGFVVLCGEKL